MKLSNNIISIEVAPHGAELVSLVRKGREYMWSGDAAFWNRRAPILFPAVGKPFNNEIRIDGQVFTMKQHGFARDCEFEEAGEGLLVMKDVRPENYPYRFALEAHQGASCREDLHAGRSPRHVLREERRRLRRRVPPVAQLAA